jgi:ParB-like chromosome segregation protein Spo0J
MNLANLEFHELADQFPLISEEETIQMADDIKKVGLIEPLVVLDGKILDGRNRYNACKLAGFKLRPEDVKDFEEDFSGEDPVVFVISKNIRRRHMTVGQRASVAAELYKRMAKDGSTAKERVKKVATAAGVAASSVEQAAHLQNKAPEHAKQVKAGKKSLNKAAKEAAKKLAGADHDAALDRIGEICGKAFVAAIKEEGIDHLKTPKAIVAFAELPDAKMLAVAPVLKQGWTLNRAISYSDKEITPATTGQQMVDLFVFKGSKRFEFEIDSVKFVLTKVKEASNGSKSND